MIILIRAATIAALSVSLHVTLDDSQKVSEQVPFIAEFKDSGKYVMEKPLTSPATRCILRSSGAPPVRLGGRHGGPVKQQNGDNIDDLFPSFYGDPFLGMEQRRRIRAPAHVFQERWNLKHSSR